MTYVTWSPQRTNIKYGVRNMNTTVYDRTVWRTINDHHNVRKLGTAAEKLVRPYHSSVRRTINGHHNVRKFSTVGESLGVRNIITSTYEHKGRRTKHKVCHTKDQYDIRNMVTSTYEHKVWRTKHEHHSVRSYSMAYDKWSSYESLVRLPKN
jgi:hypothetical protein